MDEPKLNNVFLVHCKHFDVRDLKDDITFHLCNAVNKVMGWQAMGAQKFKGVWSIRVKTEEARTTLLKRHIMIDSKEVKLYAHNPYTRRRHDDESERIVIKDFPMWEPNSMITTYFETQPHIETVSDEVYYSKARNNSTKGTSAFVNGDRFLFVKCGFDPPLPKIVQIGGYECRTWYSSRDNKCLRCDGNHKTDNTSKCPAYRESSPNVNPFSGGPCSNFYRCTVDIDEMSFASSEHAYQWYACTELVQPDLAEKVFHAKTPFEAKKLAAPLKNGNPKWENVKYDVMKKVLMAKAESNGVFRNELLNSGDSLWVECSTTDLYWGNGLTVPLTATTDPSYYPGKNKLGQALGEIRDAIRSKMADELIKSPADHNPESDASTSVNTVNTDMDTDNPNSDERQSRAKEKAESSQTRSSSLPQRASVNKLNTPLIKKFFKQQTFKSKTKRLSSRPQAVAKLKDDENQSDADAGSVTSFGQFVDNFLADRSGDFEDEGDGKK